MTNAYEPLTPGATRGRYCIGTHELTSGDVVEFTDGEHIYAGRVEHDGLRYIVVCGDRRLPLAELTQPSKRS